MAYAERVPIKNRTLAIVTVAGLHGMALYGLVTGLGVEYVEQYIPTLTGGNTPIDPPPPSPEPRPEPTQAIRENAQTTVTPRPIDFATSGDTKPVTLSTFPTQPADPPFGPIARFAQPMVEPTEVAPRLARPRNDPQAWVTTDDYPAGSLRRGEQGLVRFDLAVGASGKVEGCRVTGSSSSAELDAATCRHVTRRARFEAATDGTGAQVSGHLPRHNPLGHSDRLS